MSDIWGENWKSKSEEGEKRRRGKGGEKRGWSWGRLTRKVEVEELKLKGIEWIGERKKIEERNEETEFEKMEGEGERKRSAKIWGSRGKLLDTLEKGRRSLKSVCRSFQRMRCWASPCDSRMGEGKERRRKKNSKTLQERTLTLLSSCNLDWFPLDWLQYSVENVSLRNTVKSRRRSSLLVELLNFWQPFRASFPLSSVRLESAILYKSKMRW